MKKENDIFEQENKLVGGIAPQPLVDKFSLYCLLYKQTRSKVIVTLLEKQLSSHSEKEMIERIGEQLSEKMEGLASSKKISFLSKVRDQLKRKKINPKHIDQIFTVARRSHAENQED